MSMEIFLIVMAGIGGLLWIIAIGTRHEETKLKLRAQMRAGGEDAVRLVAIVEENQKEVARLRDRVAVLEKLVTDDDRKLASDIESLRGADRHP